MQKKLLKHCGPIQYPGLECARTSEGIVATKLPHEIYPAKTDPWSANWIWLNPTEFDEFQTNTNSFQGFAVGLFRKQINLDSIPQKVNAWVSADTRYRLYINGRLAGRGPAQIGGDIDFHRGPDWWFYDQYDFTADFKQGGNIITVEVLHHRDVGADLSSGHSGFLFEALVEGSDHKKHTILSDTTWKGNLGESFLLKTIYDARQEPGEWHELEFDDSKWSQANIVEKIPNKRWNLIPSRLLPLMEYQYPAQKIHLISRNAAKYIENSSGCLALDQSQPMRIKGGENVEFMLEFDKEVSGYLQFGIDSQAGVTFTFEFQENKGKTSFTDMYTSKKGDQTFELFRLRPCQFLNVKVQFTECEDKTMAVEIFYIGINFVAYPVKNVGQFTCSDPNLTAIWNAGRYTEQLCMQTYHLDSPVHQEPLGDHGDYMIEDMVDFYCFNEFRLARQDIVKSINLFTQLNCLNFHTSYSLLWVQMLMDYYDYSGDETIIHEAFPIVQQLLTLFQSYVGESGIITEARNYMFMDWINVDGFNLHHPPSVIGQGYMTAFYYNALHLGEKIATICNNLDTAKKYANWADALKKAFHTVLWDSKKQMYCDGRYGLTHVAPSNWMPKDPKKIYFTKQTNVLAVLYGLVPENSLTDHSNARALMHRVMQDKSLPVVQPYYMHFVFNALSHVGLFDDYGLTEIRKWTKILQEHPHSLKESWDMGDFSHAWSATPTFQLSARTLGVTPLMPGFKKVQIAPIFGDLTWVKGIVPTPQGLISVSWEKSKDEIKITIELPANMTGQFVFNIPLISKRSEFILTQNGISIANDKSIIDLNNGLVTIICKKQ